MWPFRPFNRYPYTDFHELNDDWILSKMHQLEEKVLTFSKDIKSSVYSWLDEHPEATTTVQDHSLTYEKLVNGTLGFVTPEMFGAAGDGITDDSTAVSDAIDFAHVNKIPLVLISDYDAHNVTSAYLCDILGNGKTINFGTHSFLYDQDITLDDVNIISTHAVDKNGNITAFLNHGNKVKSITIHNVSFDCTSATDALRGYIFLRVLSDQLMIDGLDIHGAWLGVIVSNTAQVSPDCYYINNVTGTNIQTLIDIEGYLSSSDYSGYLKNVTITNIQLINTQTQAGNYSSMEGSDAVLVINVDGLFINNVKSVYAVERTIYCTNVKNAHINGITTEYSQSVKVVGTQLHVLDPNLSGYIKSSNIIIDDINVHNATNGYALLMYEVDHASVSNILFQNDTATMSDYGIGLTGVCSNINISHVRGSRATRGLFYIYAVSNRDNNLTFVKINDVRYDYPVGTGNYYAVRIEGINSTFVHYITLDDIVFNEGFIKYSTGSDCSGLIKANYAEHIVMNNCEAKFIKTLGSGINFDAATCSDISVNGLIEVPTTPCAIDFVSTSGVFTVTQSLTRNNYSTKIESVNQNTTTPQIQNKYKQTCTMMLAAQQTQYLSDPITSGHIAISASTGYLEGYFSGGSFTSTHQAGTVGTSGTDIIFDPDDMSLTMASGAAISITVDIMKNS